MARYRGKRRPPTDSPKKSIEIQHKTPKKCARMKLHSWNKATFSLQSNIFPYFSIRDLYSKMNEQKAFNWTLLLSSQKEQGCMTLLPIKYSNELHRRISQEQIKLLWNLGYVIIDRIIYCWTHILIF